MQKNYYSQKLYPLQDRFLKTIETLDVEFYLTGGTALSRCYLFHRYSDDLDFFVNASKNYKADVEKTIQSLKNIFDITIGTNADTFCRIFVTDGNTQLKLDFVNDVEAHYGDFISTEIFNKTDNPLNILSNKISALPRNEPKDIADILFLCRKYTFDWKTIICQAQEKDIWVEPIEISKIINEFPVVLFNQVNWIEETDYELAEKDLKKISYDILVQSHNTVFEGKKLNN